MDNMSRNKPNTSMTNVACEPKLRSVLSLSIHPCPRTVWQSDVRSCTMPTHLVQELNVGTIVVVVVKVADVIVTR